jgi:RNA polymerase sigma-70 factor (ECF subfamily)
VEHRISAAWTGPRLGNAAAGRSGASAAADATVERSAVDAVLAGDREAFRQLVDAQGDSVVRTCYRILGDHAEAEDAAQETFMIAFRSLATWRADGPFGAWLRRIGIRVALREAARRRSVAWRMPAGTPDEETSAADRALDRASLAAAHVSDPAALSVQAERMTEIRSAILALPESYREVVALRVYGEASLEEIALETGRSLGTVKNHLHRGLVKLRVSLGEVDP